MITNSGYIILTLLKPDDIDFILIWSYFDRIIAYANQRLM